MHLLTLNNLAINLKAYDLLIYYIIYSFLGWCVEVGYAYKHQRKFVNRGFLHGPLCPIYGAAVLSVVLTLSNFHYNLFIMLIIATLMTSFIEYFTGFILEKLFKTKYWDYTEDPLNLHGRICLSFSIMWGIVSLLIVRIVHPIVMSAVSIVPEGIRIEFSILIFILLLIDFISTLNSLINFKEFIYGIQLDGNSFNTIRIRTGNIQNFFQELREKINNIKKKNL